MIVVGLETATDVGSVAIVENGRLRGELRIIKRFAQSRYLIQSIDFLMTSLEMTHGRPDGIAVSIGPGSYTGLRIGLSVAKALSFAWDIPLTAINSLDAFAQSAVGQSSVICPLIRFRRDEYYYSLYSRCGSQLDRQSDYMVGPLSEIVANIEPPAVFLGTVTEENRRQILEREGFHHFQDNLPSAHWVASLGEKNLQKGIVEDSRGITPFYMHGFPVK